MARGSKAKYTHKQKRQAKHIETSYVVRGLPNDEAASRAWAMVNKQDGGGKKSGSGRAKKVTKAPTRQGGRKGRPPAVRSASAKKAARPHAKPRTPSKSK